jgi:hypothetical protein
MEKSFTGEHVQNSREEEPAAPLRTAITEELNQARADQVI